jgi:hypothetical protein
MNPPAKAAASLQVRERGAGATSRLSRMQLAWSRLAPRAAGWLDLTSTGLAGEAARCALARTGETIKL